MNMVPAARLELARTKVRQILSLLCLPIPPSRHPILCLTRCLKEVKKLPAFSLLETAIALSILGTVSYGALRSWRIIQTQQQHHRTHERFDTITRSLAAYVLAHKVLPCPADPKENSGVSRTSCTNASVGRLPFRTLGLSEEMSRDGYHFPFTYAVQPDLTDDRQVHYLNTEDETVKPQEVFCECKPSYGELTVIDASSRSMIETAHHEDFIAYVLVSHGPKGEGAYADSGNRRSSAFPDKIINANDEDVRFVDRPLSSTFDDRVRWVTRNHLLAVYGQTPCKPRFRL